MNRSLILQINRTLTSLKSFFSVKVGLVMLLGFAFGTIYAQDCTGYHQYHCTYGDYTFFYSRQSKSMLFQKGETNEMKIVAYGGEEYYIAVCAHRKFGQLQYRILEDNADRTLIYDNAADNYSESIVLSNEKTRNLIVEVTVPNGEGKDKGDKRCVGVVIQFRKIGGEEGGDY